MGAAQVACVQYNCRNGPCCFDGEAVDEAELRRTRHQQACALGSKCPKRDLQHLSVYAHPFDFDYQSLCSVQGVDAESPSLLGLFNWIDLSQTGKLTRSELESAIPLLAALEGRSTMFYGVNMDSLDVDQNGVCNFNEFADWAGPRLGLPVGLETKVATPASPPNKSFLDKSYSRVRTASSGGSAMLLAESKHCRILGCTCEGFTKKNLISKKRILSYFAGESNLVDMPKRFQDRLETCKCGHKYSAHCYEADTDDGCSPFPPYWLDHIGMNFIDLVALETKTTLQLFQTLLDATHEKVWTRDRKRHSPEDTRVPTRYRVVRAKRSENSKAWRQYNINRQRLMQDCNDARVANKFEEVNDVKSTQEWVRNGGAMADRLAPECNEWYLFHGTTDEAAEQICRTQFKLTMSGKSTGSLYGRGIYFAESITKADEYAKPNKNGEYTVLLCRTLGGRVNHVREKTPDQERLLSSVIEGPYDSILGDRKAVNNTFREFVFYDTENFLPEYIIYYERDYEPQQAGVMKWLSSSLG